MLKKRDCLIFCVHFLWVTRHLLLWPPWSLPQLVVGSSQLQRWRHFVQVASRESTCVWQSSRMHVFLHKTDGSICSILWTCWEQSSEGRKERDCGRCLPPKVQLWEEEGRTQGGCNFVFPKEHPAWIQATWRLLLCKPQLSIAVLVLLYVDKQES